MRYANTILIGGLETVAVVLPLSAVPQFDPANPPQPNTYAVPDEVEVGWVREGGAFVAPSTDLLRQRKALEVRSDRARRLAASDWTQLPDVPLTTKTEWAAYRQALRDVTGQVGFPFDVVWPTPPA